MDQKRRSNRKKTELKRTKYSQENDPPEVKDNSVEEERQFKLRRFVNDVKKYYDVKEKPDVEVRKNCTTIKNMIQSKLCTRGDLKKEMKTKLDINLRQIIGLKNKNENYCDCKCKPHCKSSAKKIVQNTLSPSVLQEQVAPDSPVPQVSSSFSSLNGVPRADNIILRTNNCEIGTKPMISSEDLDLKLYPDFIRIATARCVQFKADHMKGLNYSRPLKEKLKAIYFKKRDCCSEDCMSEKHKSSVATSPMSTASEPIKNNDQPFIPNFILDTKKYTTAQFLQETIGPASSFNESCQWENDSGTSDSNHTTQAPISQPYIDHYLRVDREETCERFQLPERESQPSSFKYNQVDGGGDRPRLFEGNLFLPPCDEESPKFKYFPRKIY